MHEVVVLMSVYNGAKYLRAQLDSILAQRDVTVRVLVRDDGSDDNCLEILRFYRKETSRVSLIAGENLGAAESFMLLVNTCDLDSQYYAFSDQDDVWEPDKLITAVRTLEEAHIPEFPLLYCSRSKLVDEDLRFLGLTSMPRKPIGFSNALIETVTCGGTIVLNKPAFDLLSGVSGSDIVMHDAWAYLVISAFGRVIFDDSGKILYRQHASNFAGGRPDFAKRWKLRLQKLVNKQDLFYRQAQSFFTLHYNHLDPSKQNVLARYLNYRESLRSRLAFALSPTVYRQKALSNVYMRLLILLGKL